MLKTNKNYVYSHTNNKVYERWALIKYVYTKIYNLSHKSHISNTKIFNWRTIYYINNYCANYLYNTNKYVYKYTKIYNIYTKQIDKFTNSQT